MTMKEKLSKENLISLLSTKGEEEQRLFERAALVKKPARGKQSILTGIDRAIQPLPERLLLLRHPSFEPLTAPLHAKPRRNDGSRDEGLRGGVRVSHHPVGRMELTEFIAWIDRIVREAKQATNGALGITLSCGEQRKETYRRWFESGADRYLLRVETSSEALYRKLHPK